MSQPLFAGALRMTCTAEPTSSPDTLQMNQALGHFECVNRSGTLAYLSDFPRGGSAGATY